MILPAVLHVLNASILYGISPLSDTSGNDVRKGGCGTILAPYCKWNHGGGWLQPNSAWCPASTSTSSDDIHSPPNPHWTSPRLQPQCHSPVTNHVDGNCIAVLKKDNFQNHAFLTDYSFGPYNHTFDEAVCGYSLHDCVMHYLGGEKLMNL